MKKLKILTILIIFLAGLHTQLNAQEPVVTWEGLKKQKEKSDNEINDAKKSLKFTTWSKRSDIYYNIHTFEIGGLYKGMPAVGPTGAERIFDKPGKKIEYRN